MSLFNDTLWGDILPGGSIDDAEEGIDTLQVTDELFPSLHAATAADLYPWTEGDLIEWMDDGLKRLARRCMVFVGRSASILTVPAQASYTLPVRHVSTLHVSYGTAPLRPATRLELEVMDESFRTTAGDPENWYEDLEGMATVSLAPVPEEEVGLAVIYEAYPSTLDAGRQNTIVPAPPPIKRYLAMRVLSEAYGREGEMESQDIAQHCRAQIEMYHQIFEQYYGKGM